MPVYSSSSRLPGSPSGIVSLTSSKRSPSVDPAHLAANVRPACSLTAWHEAHARWNCCCPLEAWVAVNTPSTIELVVDEPASCADHPLAVANTVTSTSVSARITNAGVRR